MLALAACLLWWCDPHQIGALLHALQADELYDAADEMGLLLWQEAMFACSPYPRCVACMCVLAVAAGHQERRRTHMHAPSVRTHAQRLPDTHALAHTTTHGALHKHCKPTRAHTCRDAAFLANVDAELTQQLLRLGSHASITLWGGNNEVEASLAWYEQSAANPHLFAVDYEQLFVRTFEARVQQVRGVLC